MPADAIVAGWDASILASFTLNAGAVVQWNDASGNGFHLAQAVAGSQPTFNAAGGPTGTPSVLFDGVDDALENFLLDLPGPGATPTCYWMIARQVTSPPFNFGRFCSAAGAGLLVFQDADPVVGQYNGINGPQLPMTLNVYRRTEVLFTGSVADTLRIGAASASGIDSGAGDPAAGFAMAVIPGAAANFGNVEICELWIFNRAPTGPEEAQLNAYATAKYGAGVLA